MAGSRKGGGIGIGKGGVKLICEIIRRVRGNFADPSPSLRAGRRREKAKVFHMQARESLTLSLSPPSDPPTVDPSPSFSSRSPNSVLSRVIIQGLFSILLSWKWIFSFHPAAHLALVFENQPTGDIN